MFQMRDARNGTREMEIEMIQFVSTPNLIQLKFMEEIDKRNRAFQSSGIVMNRIVKIEQTKRSRIAEVIHMDSIFINCL
jgi:hypothetical protein